MLVSALLPSGKGLQLLEKISSLWGGGRGRKEDEEGCNRVGKGREEWISPRRRLG